MPRLVEKNGQRLLVSQGISQADIDLAVEHFEMKSSGRGIAQQIADFAKPLIDEAEGDFGRIQTAFQLGTIIWNIALCNDRDAQEEMISEIVRPTNSTKEDEKDFRVLVSDMIARHRTMFPELHR
ncbi:MAG: hypothetical protein OK454_03000 [Thaumarchaeota archaeon]|nr:hypothetical protein [Nitrososphaerota archaeon]